MTLPGFKNTTNMRSIVLDAALRLAFIRLEDKYPTKRLDDLTSISSGGTPSRTDSTFYGGEIPWAKIGDVTAAGKWISDTEEYITEIAIEQSSAKLFPVGTVLFSMYGSIGKTSIATRPITTNQAILGLIPSDALLSEFLYYALINARGSLFAQSKGTSQRNINGGMVKNFEIPLPPLDEQQNIVEYLSLVETGQEVEHLKNLPDYLLETRSIVAHVESLVARVNEAQRLREEIAESLNDFVASYHVHYSDKTAKLSDVLVLDEDKEIVNPENSYPQIGVKGFGKGLFARETLPGTQTNYKWFNRLYYGAVVLSQVKGWEGAIGVVDKSLVGKFASPEYRTFRCKPNQALPEYLSELFATPWFYLQLKTLSRGVGGRRERIRPELFVELEIPMPDIERQKRAVEVFAKFPALRELQSASGEELSALMPSILDKAFRGEL